MKHLRIAIASLLVLNAIVLMSPAAHARAPGAPAPGTKEACLTAADEGQSLRDDGKHMLAREQFLGCAREVCPRIVRDQCTEWLRQLDESTPTVVFGAKDDHGNDVTSARVTADGKLITDHLDGKPFAMDPGPHDIVFERPGSQPVTVHVVLRTGEKNRDVSPTNAYLLLLNGMGGDRGSGDGRRSSPLGSARNVTSAALLVAGVAAAGTALAFGIQSRNEAEQAAGLRGSLGRSYACTLASTPACHALGDAVDRQNSDAALSTGFFVAGGILAGAAAATWLLWPRSHEGGARQEAGAWIAPAVAAGQAGLRVGGVF
ncbi:MAG: hypothetical protein M3O50_09760 [Myxococcota bacterium]|nr:hypothetical protein [Myxococcota bacterium]